ncbi:MAG: bifunctional DNA-formamidopyrimidine glycosylase/DNA-(apurinic or apyrimidinic site) lyase [Candidatus Actinomarina sp.]
MPELPEVESVRKSLTSVLIGQKLIKFKILDKRIGRFNSRTPVLGSKLISINRKGKVIFLDFLSFSIAIHLGMTGRVMLNAKPNKFTHVILDFEKDKVNYQDVRKFGFIKVVNKIELKQYLLNLGPDSLNLKYLEKLEIIENSKRKKQNIKKFLLDQKNISGIGNIYCNEILYLSKIHPDTKVSNMSENEWKIIFINTKKVLNSAIKNNGTTLEDLSYFLPNGEYGKNQNFLKIYQKDKCNFCKSKVDKIYIDKRATYICGKCQKLIN